MTTTARAWLTIAHGGGRWTAREVATQMPSETIKAVESTLSRLGDRGFLRIYERDASSDRVRYGVTGDCRIPRGVTAWEVTEAMGMQLRPHVDEGFSVGGMTVKAALDSMAMQVVAA
jgi:hypothetical protein